MNSLIEILEWADNFDGDKYSIQVYEELVTEGRKHPSKFEIMGAWKTGCLKPNKDGKEYIDDNGTSYSFTNRWDDHTPVGKTTWLYINKNADNILQQIPERFPSNKPDILTKLQERTSFGFIWGLFTLHCIYPKEYPLYDQHVYRAFKNEQLDCKSLPQSASNNWKDYVAYKKFFDAKLAKYEIDYWILDRALWSYGKWLKQGIVIAKNKYRSEFQTVPKEKFLEFIKDENWKQEYTLGSQAKPFLSKINESLNLHIRRQFKNKPNDVISKFSSEDLNAIQSYMKDQNWIPLANSISKMKNGSEIPGLGSFVYNNIRGNTTFAQSTSQLAAIFVTAGIWEFDIKRVGSKGNKRMVFKFRDIDWKEALIDYYIEMDEE
ncbi:hypothetical protein [Dyadobacter frigoris]|uniref:Uncharacterized protein n=1 Tax=Dyadobacter frigoris TaxID=2576211 RepID=A0A4U6DHG7_9BACT|nr:hypothetical protein [Dyadobacter frigoris]TKT94154.1 hypothetical protein FDK13_02780 [Dyadobacter frigoris]